MAYTVPAGSVEDTIERMFVVVEVTACEQNSLVKGISYSITMRLKQLH